MNKIEFIKQNENHDYVFNSEKDGKKTTHIVSANSKAEAEKSVVEILNPATNIVDVEKEKLIAQSRYKVSKLLTATDYKVVRHRDEEALIENGSDITTTLTAEEYDELLNQRKALRDWSNAKEIEINKVTTIEELEKIDTEY